MAGSRRTEAAVLVAIEGLDGSGKATLTAALTAELAERGARVRAMAFPRYGRSLEADLASEALHGHHGDLGAGVHAMAVLFALDRARAAAEIRSLTRTCDVVLLDRYAASNAAFGAARLSEDARGSFAEWVLQLELGRLQLPVPDLQVLLAVDPDVAAGRAVARADTDAARVRDAFERDAGLQERTGEVYAGLARAGWGSPWQTVDGHGDPGSAVAAVVARLGAVSPSASN